jgi:dipeptidyl aminopeptidase/acylaminoacyl peptidase
MRLAKIFASAVCAAMVVAMAASVQQKRAIQPSDCVTVRYLSDDVLHRPIAMNPQGTRIAYLIKSPDLASNRNNIELYVSNLAANGSGGPHRLLVGQPISMLNWLGDGRHLTALWKHDGRTVIEAIDAESGMHQTIARVNVDIKEYSVDLAGNTIVFATEASSNSPTTLTRGLNFGHTQEEIARGYRVPAQEDEKSAFPSRKIFFIHRVAARWTRPRQLTLHSPFSGIALPEIPYPLDLGLRLSLSPNGRKLLITYVSLASTLPERWTSNSYVRLMLDAGYGGVVISALYDTATGDTSLPFTSPSVLSLPLWSEDSRSFAVVAQPTIEQSSGQEDAQGKLGRRGGPNLFWVDLTPSRVEQIVPRVANILEQPLSWTPEGGLLVHTSPNTITEYGREDGRWKERSEVVLPTPRNDRHASLAGNLTHIVGDYQNTTTPPEIFSYTRGQNEVKVLAKLNPQFDVLTIAPAEQVRWKTSEGLEVSGLLFTPPGYTKDQRYPLIIQTHPATGGFACDSGEDHFPSYIPQPAANAGIMYLIQTYPEGWDEANWEAHYPKGYPGEKGNGGLEEAASAMDVWDNAVRTLDESGLIDPKRVGIEGFSRKGWYVEFILAHAKTHYRAATAADNVQYSLGEYWLSRANSRWRAYDLLYGGPPYRESLKSWMDFSVSFNLDKFHTPLLMERMGYGDTPYREDGPLSLSESFEVFAGLSHMKKPVELFYYPDEDHQPEHPQARLATLQRNLDWYRFWLQDYERPGAEGRRQYERWRGLRQLQGQDYPADRVDTGVNSGMRRASK